MARTSQSLSYDLERQFETQENCDVFFEVDEYTIGVHKFMLQARNEVLYNMVKSWSLGDKPIPIKDMDYDSFETFLRYIYTDEIFLTNENVFHFLHASTHFKMPQLEELCVCQIRDSISAKNVCILMNEAINFESPLLQENCKEVFSKQTHAVLEDKSFLETSQPAMSLLLDAENCDVLEIQLYGYVKKWITLRCTQLKIPLTGANMRHVIGDALYKIRFPTMTVQDFANSVTTIKGLLTDTELAQVFQMITVFDTSNIDCPFSNKFRCQNNFYYSPFNDIAQLSKQHILYNLYTNQFCDIESMVNYVEELSDRKQIEVTSLRLVLQCCADLANSQGRSQYATSNNHAIRQEIKDDFRAWQDGTDTKNIQNIMTNYMQMRNKLDKICTWQ